MYNYIKGIITELTPAEAILESYGIGYSIQISLQTYEALKGKDSAKIYLYHHIREDEELFFGFATKDERELFKLLISVSGVGVSTARMMLSSLTDNEIRNAIIAEDVNTIKSIKGIGLKTAQRLILELKDKVIKGEGAETTLPIIETDNNISKEASTALIMLGFSKASINKVLPGIIKNKPGAKVEEIIKDALQRL